MNFITRYKNWLKGGGDDNKSIREAREFLGELRDDVRVKIETKEFESALLSIRSILRLGWWAKSNVKFDSQADLALQEIGSSLASDYCGERTRVLYVTSGILAFGGITQLLVNNLEYHNHDKFHVQVLNTDLFPKSDLESKRAKRIQELCKLTTVKASENILEAIQRIKSVIIEERIGRLVYIIGPDDVAGYALPGVFPNIPSILVNANHHVFSGGSFQFDALVDLTGHYLLESKKAMRNDNIEYISLGGRMELGEADNVKSRDFRKELGIPIQSLLTITVGNISKNTWGGDNSYIDIIGKVLSAHHQVHHLLLSNGSERLRDVIFEKYPNVFGRIHCIEPTPNIVSALKGCDIYLNSFPVGGGLSTLDAILSNLPAVLIGLQTAWFKMPEYTATDTSSYIRILTLLIEDERFRNKCRKNLGQFYKATLSPSLIIEKYENLFDDIKTNPIKKVLKESSLELIDQRAKSFPKRFRELQEEFSKRK